MDNTPLNRYIFCEVCGKELLTVSEIIEHNIPCNVRPGYRTCKYQVLQIAYQRELYKVEKNIEKCKTDLRVHLETLKQHYVDQIKLVNEIISSYQEIHALIISATAKQVGG